MYLPLQPNLFSLTDRVGFLLLTFIRKLFQSSGTVTVNLEITNVSHFLAGKNNASRVRICESRLGICSGISGQRFHKGEGQAFECEGHFFQIL